MGNLASKSKKRAAAASPGDAETTNAEEEAPETAPAPEAAVSPEEAPPRATTEEAEPPEAEIAAEKNEKPAAGEANGAAVLVNDGEAVAAAPVEEKKDAEGAKTDSFNVTIRKNMSAVKRRLSKTFRKSFVPTDSADVSTSVVAEGPEGASDAAAAPEAVADLAVVENASNAALEDATAIGTDETGASISPEVTLVTAVVGPEADGTVDVDTSATAAEAESELAAVAPVEADAAEADEVSVVTLEASVPDLEHADAEVEEPPAAEEASETVKEQQVVLPPTLTIKIDLRKSFRSAKKGITKSIGKMKAGSGAPASTAGETDGEATEDEVESSFGDFEGETEENLNSSTEHLGTHLPEHSSSAPGTPGRKRINVRKSLRKVKKNLSRSLQKLQGQGDAAASEGEAEEIVNHNESVVSTEVLDTSCAEIATPEDAVTLTAGQEESDAPEDQGVGVQPAPAIKKVKAHKGYTAKMPQFGQCFGKDQTSGDINDIDVIVVENNPTEEVLEEAVETAESQLDAVVFTEENVEVVSDEIIDAVEDIDTTEVNVIVPMEDAIEENVTLKEEVADQVAMDAQEDTSRTVEEIEVVGDEVIDVVEDTTEVKVILPMEYVTDENITLMEEVADQVAVDALDDTSLSDVGAGEITVEPVENVEIDEILVPFVPIEKDEVTQSVELSALGKTEHVVLYYESSTISHEISESVTIKDTIQDESEATVEQGEENILLLEESVPESQQVEVAVTLSVPSTVIVESDQVDVTPATDTGMDTDEDAPISLQEKSSYEPLEIFTSEEKIVEVEADAASEISESEVPLVNVTSEEIIEIAQERLGDTPCPFTGDNTEDMREEIEDTSMADTSSEELAPVDHGQVASDTEVVCAVPSPFTEGNIEDMREETEDTSMADTSSEELAPVDHGQVASDTEVVCAAPSPFTEESIDDMREEIEDTSMADTSSEDLAPVDQVASPCLLRETSEIPKTGLGESATVADVGEEVEVTSEETKSKTAPVLQSDTEVVCAVPKVEDVIKKTVLCASKIQAPGTRIVIMEEKLIITNNELPVATFDETMNGSQCVTFPANGVDVTESEEGDATNAVGTEQDTIFKINTTTIETTQSAAAKNGSETDIKEKEPGDNQGDGGTFFQSKTTIMLENNQPHDSPTTSVSKTVKSTVLTKIEATEINSNEISITDANENNFSTEDNS